MTAKVIEVIVTEGPEGSGNPGGEICRIVKRYFTKEGELIATHDPCPDGKAPKTETPRHV